MPIVHDVLVPLGAAVIGGVVAPHVTQARERRQARAAASNALFAVKQARWGNVSYSEFRMALYAFQGAALCAGLPRSMIRCYVGMARVARYVSWASYQSAVEAEEGYAEAIDARLEQTVQAALDMVTDALWHPVQWHLRESANMRSMNRVVNLLRRETRDVPTVRWDLFRLT